MNCYKKRSIWFFESIPGGTEKELTVSQNRMLSGDFKINSYINQRVNQKNLSLIRKVKLKN